ncbi:sensor histidine kinase [Pseudonocardia sediminis]|uniref:sensor histidine kinase n=1 Tax=Pseudonocardia sediminis TaxID=1397368 RepID=UPI001F5F6727|nr:histidine kinase [Pseudonocardia sediminis]
MTVLRQLPRMSYRALRDGRTYRRVVHLLLGAVVLLAYLAVVALIVSAAGGGPDLAIVALALVAAAAGTAIALMPGVRALEITAARALLDVVLPDPAPGAGQAWPARRRGAAWWTVPLGLVLPVVALLLLAAAGGGLARLAPRLLGPAPAERLAAELAAAERRAAALAERARLARELHDSVGHALTVTTLQAGAAAQVLDTDREFARRALDAIAETGRAALDDLDHVLGLLREDGGAAGTRAPVRDLRSLETLVTGARSAGVEVAVDVDGDPEALPSAVSREAYRLVQEALTNALRHAGPVPVSVRLSVDGAGVALAVDNPLPARRSRSRDGGGTGLRGMTERAALLGGELTAGPRGDVWHLAARLPGAAVS